MSADLDHRAPAAPSPPGDPDLVIVIVCHDDREDLARCLERLFEEAPKSTHQVVVVDNASTDGTVELINRRWPDVLILENPTNLGFARAVNRGIRTTSSEFVLLLNPDTLPNGRVVDALAATLRAEPDAAAVGPRIVDGAGSPEISWWSHLGPLTEWSLRRLRHAYERGVPRATQRVEQLTSRRRDVGWLTGACLMVRRQAAIAAG